MDPYATVDETRFPLVRITFTGNKSNDQNFKTYLDETKACYRHEEKLAIIFDASNAGVPSLSHQKMQADWLRENRKLMEDYCAGTVYIIPKPAIRAILKVIFSFQKQPLPYKIVEHESEAAEWVKGLDSGWN